MRIEWLKFDDYVPARITKKSLGFVPFLRKNCHPDLHGDSKTKEFQELTAAYQVLSDTRKKAAYDASGYQDRNYDTPQQQGYPGSGGYYEPPPRPEDAFKIFNEVLSNLLIMNYIGLG